MTPSKKTRIANIATYSCGGLFALILVISWFVDKRPPNATLALIESGKAGRRLRARLGCWKFPVVSEGLDGEASLGDPR